jgi:hypothetical protein
VRLSGLLIVGLLCTAAVLSVMEIDVSSTVDSKLARFGFRDAVNDPLLDQLTVVTIATRGYDSRQLVTTLRNQGLFSGDLVVISDNCSPSPESSRIVRVASNADALQSKRLKTQVFELATSVSRRSVLFMDADIEVNKPLSSFMQAVHRAEDSRSRDTSAPTCNGWFNKERAWHRHKQGHLWQGGFFYLPNEEASGPLLRTWEEAIDELPPGSLDQTALLEALRRNPDLHICELPPDMSYVPDMWSRIMGVRATTFTHFTKSSEVRLRPKKDRGFAKALLRGVGSSNIPRPPRRVEVPSDSEC